MISLIVAAWLSFVLGVLYKGVLKDDGYFSSISPLKRIEVAENTYDLGEFLVYLRKTGELSTDFGPAHGRMAYYPPCHLREQEIGQPYLELLRMIPRIGFDSTSTLPKTPIYPQGGGSANGVASHLALLSSRTARRLSRLNRTSRSMYLHGTPHSLGFVRMNAEPPS